MAATWTFDGPGDDFRFANRGARIITVTGTRTLDGTSKQYTVPSFRVQEGVPLAEEADRLIDELEAVSEGDPFWDTPELTALFPNAAAVLKTKADAMEVFRG